MRNAEPSPQAHQEQLLINESEAAHALGVAVSTLKKARLHRLASNSLRNLPYVKIGRSIRYRRSDIEHWIAENTFQPHR